MNHASYSIETTGGEIGADIQGIDLSQPLSSQQVNFIRRAWTRHLVLRFRGQDSLSIGKHIEFSKNFGELDRAPIRSASTARGWERPDPYITVISNIKVDGKDIGSLGSSEAVWHSDMTYTAQPPKGSCLRAIEVPAEGGNTHFLNMYEAYDLLDDATKARIQTLSCVHDASRNSAGELRAGHTDQPDPTKTVGAVHPLVATHPESGRKSLFLGRRRNAYIPLLPLDESEALLDFLWAHATKRGPVWTQRWRVGDVVIWDNRCTMHKRDEFAADARRLMYRTQIQGHAITQ